MFRKLTLILLFATTLLPTWARNERDTLGVGVTLSFVENRGQWMHPFRYEAQLHNAALFLEDDCITVALRTPISHPQVTQEAVRQHAYRMYFDGCNIVSPMGLGEQPLRNNYLLGADPSTWRSQVPQYNAVHYNDIYNHIDFEIYGGSHALKYNFIVHPGGDPSQIALIYEGTDGVEVTSSGSLRIRTSVRDIMELKPYVYQADKAGNEHEVPSRWRVRRTKDGLYRATVELDEYDHRQDLVIDPVLIFSTYTGSTADNWGTTAAYDSRKNVYTAGLVFDMGYPTSLGALDITFNGNCDIGIFKFDSTGTNRLYATYLGGSQADMPHSLFVNTFDELLIFGTTGSNDFPVTPGAYQTIHAGGTSIGYEDYQNLNHTIYFPNGSDIFVSRISADGSQLQASTFVGGSGNDGLNYRINYNANYGIIMGGNDSLYYNYGDGARGEIITDNLNNIYVGSTTFSTDFPVTDGCVQPRTGGKQDGVVFKLDYNLRNMLWSTYLGGAKDDAIYSIDVDSSYNLLVCGGTNSTNFPVTSNVYQGTYGGGTADGFVGKLSYGGERLISSTYFGYQNYDQLYFVRNGRHDEIFLFGQTKNSGAHFIYNAAYGVVNAGMLLARMKPDMSALRWSTVFGTPGRINLSPTAFSNDICNRIYAVGWGRDFVGLNGVQWNTAGTTGMETTPDAFQDTTDGQDFYIISLGADGNSLEYASFFGEIYGTGSSIGGSDHVDGGTSRFDRLATLYQSVCASCYNTTNHNHAFPTTAGAWSDSNGSSNCNNAIFRFNVKNDFPVAEFVPPAVGCAPYSVQFHNTGRGSSFYWDFGDGVTSTLREPTHTYTAAGMYTVTLIATMPSGCATADTMQYALHVIGNNTAPTVFGTACNNNSIQIGPVPQIGATYRWLTTNVSDTTIANPWVADSGIYLLQVSGPGCSEVDTFHVRTYNLIDTCIFTPISCHDSTDGSATFVIGDGLSPDSLTITVSPPSTSHTLLPNASIRMTGLHPDTTYLFSVDGYGCHYEYPFSLANPPTPPYEKKAATVLCTDTCNAFIHIYQSTSHPNAIDTLRSNLCAGTYVTQLDANGCPLIDTTIITRSHRFDNLRLWADLTKIYLGQSVMLHAEVSDNEQVSYSWSPAVTLDRPDIPTPVATPVDTLAVYTLTATDGICTMTDTLIIHCIDVVCGDPEFIIPNAFTPNGDGINDRLCFNGDILADFSILIYNRWGQCVYQSTDPSQCWDGTYHNAQCLPGVYTYTCHIRCHNGTENDFKGDITLIR